MNPLTIEGLKGWYVQRRQFVSLAPESRRSYLHHLGKLCTLVPKEQTAGRVTAEEADDLYELAEARLGRHAAVTMLRVTKRMYNVAMRYPTQTGVTSNPFTKMGLPGLKKREEVWEEEDVWAFWETSKQLDLRPVGLLAMLCYTLAQRPVDMRQLKWENLVDRSFVFIQQKTKVQVRLWIPDHLWTILSETPRKGEFVCAQANGRGFDNRLYNKLAAQIREEAGIPDELKIADLRRTAFTEMGDAGTTDQGLMAYGHTNREQLSTYTVRSVAQSKAAAEKRFGSKNTQ